MATRAILFLVVLAVGVSLLGTIPVADNDRDLSRIAASNAPTSGSPEQLRRKLSKPYLPPTAPSAAIVKFDIPAKPLSSALLEFGRQAEVSLVLPTRPFEGFVSAPVHGELSREDALGELLRCLPFRGRTQDNTLSITSRDGSAVQIDPPETPAACETRGMLVS